MTSQGKSGTNHKRCARCHRYKPIREFDIPRHRMCTDCRKRANLPVVEQWLATHTMPLPKADAAAEWAARKSGVDLTPTEFGPVAVPAITTTWHGQRKYMRERARLAAASREAERRAFGLPVAKVKYRDLKKCVRCKEIKPAIAFEHPRYRVCMVCDGPPIFPASLIQE